MLDALRFTKGAISTKTFEPTLKHFRIKDERVQAYNGVLSLSSPIECDLNVQPLATPFVNAIQLCEDTVSLHLTDTGRLAINSGKFRAYIDCAVEPFPEVVPSGPELELEGGLLDTLQFLAPIMGTDASRLWSHGILLTNQSAYVTNNIVLIEKWLGYMVPNTMGLPSVCVKELLRIGEEPLRIQSDGRTVTFHFEEGRWLSSSLLQVAQWPDPSKLLEQEAFTTEVTDALFEAIEKVKPFTGELNSVWLKEDGTVSTSNQDEEGAHLQVTSCKGMRGRYSADQFLRLKGLAKRIDWTAYPKPCLFYGDGVRGVIIGLNE